MLTSEIEELIEACQDYLKADKTIVDFRSSEASIWDRFALNDLYEDRNNSETRIRELVKNILL